MALDAKEIQQRITDLRLQKGVSELTSRPRLAGITMSTLAS